MSIKKETWSALLKILLEVVMIFISVYAAFVLEDKRNKDFERELLIGKLKMLEEEIRLDSLKIHDLFVDINPMADYNLNEDVFYDSLAIAFLQDGSSAKVDSVGRLFYEYKLFNGWGEEWLHESPTYEYMASNYGHLLIHQETAIGLDVYFMRRRYLNQSNKLAQTSIDQLYDQMKDKYHLPGPFTNSRELAQIVTSTYFKNWLQMSLGRAVRHLQEAKDLRELSGNVLQLVHKEIVAQEEKL